MIINLATDLLDPRTKQSTAFYAALGITLWDILRHGFNPYSVAMLGAMAGVGVLGAIGAVKKSSTPPE